VIDESALKPLLDAVSEIEVAPDEEALEQLRVRYLGRSGVLRALIGKIAELPASGRAAAGKRLNEIKVSLESKIESRRAVLRAKPPPRAFFDVTLPGVPIGRGSLHPLTLVTEELLAVFGKLGFRLARGPEVETEFYNFEALNIPRDHPARDREENFFLVERIDPARARVRTEGPMAGFSRAPEADSLLLRSQTSTVQIRVLTRERPPVRVVAPGRVFRPDTVDATHHFQFHQIEGLAVDEGISFADLKTVLVLFAKELFGERQQVRLRPSFFPFTEPSGEVDFLCWFCGGSGCPTCKQAGWIEMGGCGMVDPNVFEAVGVDPERYTGFAFGIGIERLAMLKYGVRDMRLFTENDVRFLEQLG